MLGSVTRTVIAVCALCAVISAIVVVVTLSYGVQWPVQQVIGEALRTAAAGPYGDYCRQAGGWRVTSDDDRVFVGMMSEATMRVAEEIPEPVRAALIAGEGWAGPVHDDPEDRRAVAIHIGADPCAYYVHTWKPPEPVIRRLLVMAPIMVVALAALAGLLGAWLLARPLRRRVNTLANAAAHIGGAYPGADVGGRDELGQVGKALDAAHARIREDRALLLRQKQALEDDLSTLAHDTNTPLTSLFMALESLAQTEDPDALRTQAEAALGDVVYLSSLIQNLALDRQLAGAPDTPAVELDLAEVTATVVGRAQRLARPRNVTVDFARPDDPVLRRGHPTLVEQALMNIVQNAVAAARSQVLVILEEASLTIADDGPGVAPEDLPHLTHRGWRAQSERQARPNGAGLGLATAQAVCDRHGWTLIFTASGRLGGLEVAISQPD